MSANTKSDTGGGFRRRIHCPRGQEVLTQVPETHCEESPSAKSAPRMALMGWGGGRRGSLQINPEIYPSSTWRKRKKSSAGASIQRSATTNGGGRSQLTVELLGNPRANSSSCFLRPAPSRRRPPQAPLGALENKQSLFISRHQPLQLV